MSTRVITAWSDHIVELEGEGRVYSSPQRGYLTDASSKKECGTWGYSAVWDSNSGEGKLSIEVLCLPISKTFLVDGSVTFLSGTSSKNGIEIKNFEVGEVKQGQPQEWVRAFRVPDVECVANTLVDFKIRVRYRLEKSYNCQCYHCDHCLADKGTTASNPPPPKPHQSLSADFQKLFLSAVGSDVVFNVGQEKISAHQIILTTRVPYFERLFAAGM